VTLTQALEAVTDSRSFLDFARVLVADRQDEIRKEQAGASSPYGPGANGWENGTIEDFLDAAIRWAEASDFGKRQGVSPDNPWRQFALFLYCGKIYE
jgi:hypothetical protein